MGEERTGGGGDAWPPAPVTVEAVAVAPAAEAAAAVAGAAEAGEADEKAMVAPAVDAAAAMEVSLNCISKRPSTRQAVA